MSRSTFFKSVLVVLLVVIGHILVMDIKRNIPLSDEKLAMMYTVDRFGDGNYEVEVGECNDEFISFTAYEDGDICCCVSINRDYYDDQYRD